MLRNVTMHSTEACLEACLKTLTTSALDSDTVSSHENHYGSMLSPSHTLCDYDRFLSERSGSYLVVYFSLLTPYITTIGFFLNEVEAVWLHENTDCSNMSVQPGRQHIH